MIEERTLRNVGMACAAHALIANATLLELTSTNNDTTTWTVATSL